MAIQRLDHYFVRARDLERSRHFYCELLGFAVMPRLRYSLGRGRGGLRALTTAHPQLPMCPHAVQNSQPSF